MTWTWEIYHETVESEELDPLANGCRCARCRREISAVVETENVVPLRLGDRVRLPGENFDRRITVTHSGGKTETLDESELAAGIIHEPGTAGLDELEAGAAEGGPEGATTLPASVDPEQLSDEIGQLADPELDAGDAAAFREAVERGRAAVLAPHPDAIPFATLEADRVCDCGWVGNVRELVTQPFTDPACPACGNWSTVTRASPEPVETPPVSRAAR